jgi:hypothetical protein
MIIRRTHLAANPAMVDDMFARADRMATSVRSQGVAQASLRRIIEIARDAGTSPDATTSPVAFDSIAPG